MHVKFAGHVKSMQLMTERTVRRSPLHSDANCHVVPVLAGLVSEIFMSSAMSLTLFCLLGEVSVAPLDEWKAD